jgi:hypothetical protein
LCLRNAGLRFRELPVQGAGCPLDLPPEPPVILEEITQRPLFVGLDESQTVRSGQADVHGGEVEAPKVFDDPSRGDPASNPGPMEVDYVQVKLLRIDPVSSR